MIGTENLEEKLSQVLNDPNSMAQLMSFAQSLGMGPPDAPPPPGPPPGPSPGPPPGDDAFVRGILQLVRQANQKDGPQEALLAADPKSLLVVVDTNRPDQVECKPLLESIRRIVVIDHHRRAADYIDQAVLNMHEPFASSASELVTELLQYAVDATDILPQEAAALLAGIVLDTKNFGVRTSSRTFEAAAFLRRIGADTVAVKKLFQNDLSATVARYRIIQNARLYRGSIAIAALDYTVTRTLAAQAADELLNISGIDTSFVLYPQDGVTYISARSLGDANVQVILEPLGGGGNAATAGAQVKNHTVQQTLDELLQSINKFYES